MDTDFNDLHVSCGLEEVRRQIMAAIRDDSPAPPLDDAPPLESDESPPPQTPPVTVADFTLEKVLERFALIEGDTRVWDTQGRKIIKRTAFIDLVTPDLCKQWKESGNKRTVFEADVMGFVAHDQRDQQSGGGLGEALARYVYVYPAGDYWDKEIRQRVPERPVALAIADCYEDFKKHPYRQKILSKNIVFDPTQKTDLETHINTFIGLPLAPAKNTDGCAGIRNLVWLLCNEDSEVFDWLVSWLAYPLQHVGAKMVTAVLMHSSKQGSGKSLLFDEIMRRIYGEYGATLGQHQLESQYTDWRSEKLYILFEEVLGRDQRYNQSGNIKHMVSGKTHRIEQKFVVGWEEANHANAVFLSNELMPFPLDTGDRRFLVVWPSRTLSVEMQEKILAEIDNGGIEAFYHWLLNRDLGDFHEHTPPLETEAKTNLIDFGRAAWEVFYLEWQREAVTINGNVLPFVSCLTVDLFGAYERWAVPRKESIIPHHKFCGLIGKREEIRYRRDVHYRVGAGKKKGTIFQIGREPDGKTQGDWLGEEVWKFKSIAKDEQG